MVQMWSFFFFWLNRFHGCFMLHRPLVFCLALTLHNVHFKQGAFEVLVLISTTHPKSACLLRQTHGDCVHSTPRFSRSFNNCYEKCSAPARPVSLPLWVSRRICACLNCPVIYYNTSLNSLKVPKSNEMKREETPLLAAHVLMLFNLLLVEEIYTFFRFVFSFIQII